MLRFLLSAAVAALAAPGPAFACSVACRCIPATALGQSQAEFVRAQRDRAERVVVGTIIRLDTLPRVTWGTGPGAVTLTPIVAYVRVRRVWRGSLADTMTVMVTTVESRSSCDLELRPSESYLIFATHTERGPLATRQCSGTVEERAAADAFEALGRGQASRR